MRPFIIAVLWALPSYATLYDQLDKAFWQSGPASAFELEGFWVGRCVSGLEPDRNIPAVYGVTRIEPSSDPLTWYNHQSTFWGVGETQTYDAYTWTDLFNDPSLKIWLREPANWGRIYRDQNSLTSRSEDGKWHQTRSHFDGDKHWILTRVATGALPYSAAGYCYFRKRVLDGPATTPSPTPTPVEPEPPVIVDPPVEEPPVTPPDEYSENWIGDTGPKSAGLVTVESAIADKPITHLIFVHRGTETITLSQLRIRIVGATLSLPGKSVLTPGQAVKVALGGSGEAVRRVEFRISRPTQGIEIRGELAAD